LGLIKPDNEKTIRTYQKLAKHSPFESCCVNNTGDIKERERLDFLLLKLRFDGYKFKGKIIEHFCGNGRNV
jgi:hypothetical protein